MAYKVRFQNNAKIIFVLMMQETLIILLQNQQLLSRQIKSFAFSIPTVSVY